MKNGSALLVLLTVVVLSGCHTENHYVRQAPSVAKQQPWRGVHLFVHDNESARTLVQELPRLKNVGVNTLVIEVNYSFDFKSHPELRNRDFITADSAKALAKAAREQGIRLIPQFNCLGHQSWRRSTVPMLERYPEFGEPVGDNTDKDGVHLRSWCPRSGVFPVAFELIDEIADAFEADAFHVGMDEVFCIASDKCTECRGGDPAQLFAKAVNALHGHIVGKRKMEMLMWGDRLLDSEKMGYGKWESSKNGTHRAADLIPKDIVICDWHYERQDNYPSVPFLLEKGFRVWPSGWQPLEASMAFSQFSRRQNSRRLVGYLCTTWSKAKPSTAADWPPIVEPLKLWAN